MLMEGNKAQMEKKTKGKRQTYVYVGRRLTMPSWCILDAVLMSHRCAIYGRTSDQEMSLYGLYCLCWLCDF